MNKKSVDVKSTEPIVVGVDDGFAVTDVVVMEGTKVKAQLCIPSRARQGIHGTTVIGQSEEGPVPCYETEGATYTVGDLSDAESARFNDYPFSGMNRVIVNHALRVAGLAGKDVRIATGLPLSTFYKGSTPNQEIIARKHQSITTKVSAADNSAMANIVDHHVFPEGLASWVDYAIGEDGQPRAPEGETVGIIDIGGRTTDVAVVLPGRRIDHARCGSADVGALDVVEQVRVALLKKLNVEIPGPSIEQALRTRSIRMWGKAVDVGAEIDAAVNQVSESVQREVNRRLGSGVDIDRILLVGGGAYLFKNVATRYPNVTIPESPEFSNARGFAKYLSLPQ